MIILKEWMIMKWVGKTKSSWKITCKILLEDNIRVHGVKCHKKYGKRETEQKMKKGQIIYKRWKMYKW